MPSTVQLTGLIQTTLSAKSGEGIRELRDMILEKLFGDLISCDFLIPYQEGAAEHFLRERAQILRSEYREDGTFLSCRLDRRLLARVKQFALL